MKEDFRILFLSAESYNGSNFQGKFGYEAAILQTVHLQYRFYIVDVSEHDSVFVNAGRPIQYVLRVLLDQSFPVVKGRAIKVDVDDPVVWSALIGAEREYAILVGNVLRVEKLII